MSQREDIVEVYPSLLVIKVYYSCTIFFKAIKSQ